MRQVLWLLLLCLLLAAPSFCAERSANFLPYAYYDSTIGTDLGFFLVLKNYLGKGENYTATVDYVENGGRDVTMRLYYPDRVDRYRTLFPLALDTEIAIGKAIADRFYGFGSATAADNYTYYNNRYNLFKITAAHAVTSNLVLETAFNYAENIFSDITQGAVPLTQLEQQLVRRYYYISTGLKISRTDNNYQPKKGEDIQANLSFGIKSTDSPADYTKIKFDFRKYFTPFNPDQILAGRLALTEIVGDNVPLYEYATLGGKNDLRGFPTYRFRGGASALFNLEYRFPLFWIIGGIFFFDSGKVFNHLGEIDLQNWATNFGGGFRVYLENLILRIDYGKSREGGNLYLYYNHTF